VAPPDISKPIAWTLGRADYNGSGEWFGRPDIIGNPYLGGGGPRSIQLASLHLLGFKQARGHSKGMAVALCLREAN
jgi:hypothetical protein